MLSKKGALVAFRDADVGFIANRAMPICVSVSRLDEIAVDPDESWF